MAVELSELDIGISDVGMAEYIEALKLDVQAIQTQLDTEKTEIMNKVDSIWVGESKDKFEGQLNQVVEALKTDIEAEYNDLKERLADLSNHYYNVDKNLMD